MIARPPGPTRADPLVPFTTVFRSLTRVSTGWQEARRRHVHVQHNDGWCLHGPMAERNAGRLGQARQERRRAVSGAVRRSEEQTSELQSLMRSSYAVFCLKKNNHINNDNNTHNKTNNRHTQNT